MQLVPHCDQESPQRPMRVKRWRSEDKTVRAALRTDNECFKRFQAELSHAKLLQTLEFVLAKVCRAGDSEQLTLQCLHLFYEIRLEIFPLHCLVCKIDWSVIWGSDHTLY